MSFLRDEELLTSDGLHLIPIALSPEGSHCKPPKNPPRPMCAFPTQETHKCALMWRHHNCQHERRLSILASRVHHVRVRSWVCSTHQCPP